MTQSFRIADVLDRPEMASFLRKSDIRGASLVAGTWTTCALVFCAVARFPSWPVFIVAWILLGGRQNALLVLTHEATHGTLMRSRRANDFVGRWLCANPIWVDIEALRRSHRKHHAYNGTRRDPDRERLLQFPLRRSELVGLFLRDLVGWTALLGLLTNVLRAFGFIDTDEVGRVTVAESTGRTNRDVLVTAASRLHGVILTNLVLLTLLVLVGHPRLYWLWVLSWMTTFPLFVRARESVEHACTPDPTDPLRNARTVEAGMLARLTVAPHGINYHLEHHLLMSVPCFRLPELHLFLRTKGVLEKSCVVDGYLRAWPLLASPTVARSGEAIATIDVPEDDERHGADELDGSTEASNHRLAPPPRNAGLLARSGARLAAAAVRVRHRR